MKSNNKRPLISCIAFVCKNTESAKRTIKHLENEYGFDLIWCEERRWRLKSANGQLVEIWTQGPFNTMRAYRYHIVFSSIPQRLMPKGGSNDPPLHFYLRNRLLSTISSRRKVTLPSRSITTVMTLPASANSSASASIPSR